MATPKKMGAVSRGEYADQVYTPMPEATPDVIASPDEGLSFAAAKTKLEKLVNSPEQINLVNNFVVNNPDLFDTETVDDAKTSLSIPRDVSLVSYEDKPTMGGMLPVDSEAALAAGKAAETAATAYARQQAIDALRSDAENAARVDAFKLIEDTLRANGFGQDMIDQLNKYLTGFTDENGNTVMVGPEEAMLLLKQTDAWKSRFYGNELLRKANKNILDTRTYLELEQNYAEAFQAYGLNRFSNRDEFAQLIGNSINIPELKSRLDLAVKRVANADPNIIKTLREFYPSITDSDIVAYFLKPDQVLPDLESKVTTAEIGAAALGQGAEYRITKARAAELATLGIDQQAALTGYQKVATVMPDTTKLAKIYNEADVKYTQQQAEEEFLLGKATAASQRRKLKMLEEASFSGQSGLGQGALGVAKSF